MAGWWSAPEGHGIAQWLNRHGIAGIVLEYRLPKGRPFVPLLDAQRAIRTVRFNAKQWNIDPGRIGIIGFSAGGHLASTAGTHFDGGDPKAADPIDRAELPPGFRDPDLPGRHDGREDPRRHEGQSAGSRSQAGIGRSVLQREASHGQDAADVPGPCQRRHAVPPDNSRMMYEALKAHKVAAEYLELPSGGHGLNGYKGPMWDAWQTKSLEWLAAEKILPAGSSAAAATSGK